MEEDTPPPQGEDPVRTCAYSGERRPESQMVRIGKHFVAFGSLLMLSIPLMIPVLVYETAAQFVPFLAHWLLRALMNSILATPYLFVVVWIFVLYKALRSESAPKNW